MRPLDEPEFDRWSRTAESSLAMARLAAEHGAWGERLRARPEPCRAWDGLRSAAEEGSA